MNSAPVPGPAIRLPQRTPAAHIDPVSAPRSLDAASMNTARSTATGSPHTAGDSVPPRRAARAPGSGPATPDQGIPLRHRRHRGRLTIVATPPAAPTTDTAAQEPAGDGDGYPQLARQLRLGVGLHTLAQVTGRTVAELAPRIVGNDIARAHHTDSEAALWQVDPVLLASVTHGNRAVADSTRSGRGLGLRSLLHRLVSTDVDRLLHHILALEQPRRLEPAVRLAIAATSMPRHVADRLTTTAAAAWRRDRLGAACLHAWLAVAHAVAGRFDEALERNADELTLLSSASPGVDTDHYAVVHARWRRAALLAAAGLHEAATHEHRALQPLLEVVSGPDGPQEFDLGDRMLLLARNDAAWGAQALCAGHGQHAEVRTAIAVDILDGLMAHDVGHDIPEQVLHHEQAAALFALGHARHLAAAGSGREAWLRAARLLVDVHPRDRQEDNRVRLLIDRHRAALRGTPAPWSPPRVRLPLPRVSRPLTDPVLLRSGMVAGAPTAPDDALPDLVALHLPTP